MGARRGPDGLTDKERAICYAVDAGLTDREAFRLACPDSTVKDYSASVGAARVRRRPHCAAFLKTLQAQRRARHERMTDRTIEELANIAFADVGDLYHWGPDGVTLKDLEALTPAQRRLVSISSTQHTVQGRTTRVKMHDKIRALDKLARLFGLYPPDPRSIDAKNRALAERAASLSDVERAQRLAAILRRGREKG